MARIVEFHEVIVDSNRVHERVECGYRVFTAESQTFVQLDTYGSKDRKIPGKVANRFKSIGSRPVGSSPYSS
jgi:hypothetical protein